MKAISQGDNTYDIFDDSLRVYDKLPAQSYVVRFSDRRGFYLSKYTEMDINEEKVYGVHLDKVNKVMNSFSEMNRSLGVILSGDKGIGKSLFAKMLSVVTCNELRKLNEYLINRPGRFHYHFRFDYPSADEIKQYLVTAK